MSADAWRVAIAGRLRSWCVLRKTAAGGRSAAAAFAFLVGAVGGRVSAVGRVRGGAGV